MAQIYIKDLSKQEEPSTQAKKLHIADLQQPTFAVTLLRRSEQKPVRVKIHPDPGPAKKI
jgi:hypothetical protein